MTPAFRLNSKTVFLTFPKCSFDPQEYYEFLSDKSPLQYYGCVEEKHASGEPHMHIMCKFNKKLDVRDSKWFDYQGHHANIGAIKNWKASINYLTKAGTPLVIDNSDESHKESILHSTYKRATEVPSEPDFSKNVYRPESVTSTQSMHGNLPTERMPTPFW